MPLPRGRSPIQTRPASRAEPASVDREVDAVDRLVLEQKPRCIHDLGHRDKTARRCPLDECLEALARHVSPLRAVTDDRGMESIHARRRELDDKSSHETRDSAVDCCDGGRTWIRAVARQAPEDEDRCLFVELREKCVDDLGVPDDLEGHESQRRIDVVLAHSVYITLDRRKNEVLDAVDTGESAGDVMRLREVQSDAAGRPTDFARAGLCGRGVAPRHDYLSSLTGIELRDFAAEPTRAADDHDRPTGHYASPFGLEEGG